jgi:hypothetical protein
MIESGSQEGELLGEILDASFGPRQLVGEMDRRCEQQRHGGQEDGVGRRVDAEQVRHRLDDARHRGDGEQSDRHQRPQERVLALQDLLADEGVDEEDRGDEDTGEDDVGGGGHVPRLASQRMPIAAATTKATSAGTRNRGMP